jgi:hypothetical protein
MVRTPASPVADGFEVVGIERGEVWAETTVNCMTINKHTVNQLILFRQRFIHTILIYFVVKTTPVATPYPTTTNNEF